MYTVEKRGTVKRLGTLSIKLVLLTAACWLAFEYGQTISHYDEKKASAALLGLEAEIDRLKEENKALLKENVQFEHASTIDREAHNVVKKALASKQQEILGLKEELAFYRSLVAPEKMERQLNIQSMFLVQDDTDSQVFQYKLTLTQRNQNGRLAKGKADIRVAGQYKSQEVTYALSDLSLNKEENINFRFKYFQSFDGSLRFVKGFDPDYLTVIITPEGKRLKGVRKTFKWTELFSRGE